VGEKIEPKSERKYVMAVLRCNFAPYGYENGVG